CVAGEQPRCATSGRPRAPVARMDSCASASCVRFPKRRSRARSRSATVRRRGSKPRLRKPFGSIEGSAPVSGALSFMVLFVVVGPRGGRRGRIGRRRHCTRGLPVVLGALLRRCRLGSRDLPPPPPQRPPPPPPPPPTHPP